MDFRPGYEIRFADGGVMTLGPPTRVMGVLNVTPDSFSDGGRHGTADLALEAAARMVEEGVDIIDVGGESTRPGAAELDPAQELDRILPVVEGIKAHHEVRVSIDTMRADVARQALDAGADVVNDITALADPAMLPLVCERRVPVVLMHMRGSPRTMQHDTNYDDLVGAVVSYLQERVDIAVSAGVKDGKILVDPGIGFGKSTSGNLEVLKQLPVLGNGAHVIRAHDVAATVRVVRMVDAIREA
jgi:dihydropteroate synthase